MATAAVQPTPTPAPPPAPLARLQSAARTMFVGLLWGGVLLLILAYWLKLKFADEGASAIAVPWIIGFVGGAALGMAVWYVYMLWFQKTPPDQKARALAAARRATGFVLIAGGALLLIIAVFLAFAQRPGGFGASLRANFGEAVGLFLFALVAMGAGRALLSPPRDELATVDLEPVRGLFPLIRTVLFLTGIILVAIFAVLAFYYKVGVSYFPELAGLLLFSMLCLAMALWLTSIPTPDSFTTRIFVLIFGGLTGLILFVMTLARAIVWRDQVFFAGIGAWGGEESWRLWLCAYSQLIALALMFGSLLLARADIRANATLRRVLFGYNTLLNGLLLLEMLVVLNIVLYSLVPYTFDWTQTRGLYNLSESTKHLLHELKKPTEVYVLMSQGFSAFPETRTLMENMQAESNQLKVEYIAPDRDLATYERLAQLFPAILPEGKLAMRDESSGRGILIVYGEMPREPKHNVPYTFIPERKIYDEEPGIHGKKASRTFKGEAEVATELNFLVHGKEKRKIYFLQGDEEIDITNNQAARRTVANQEMSLLGASALVDKLKKDNYEVQGLTFSKEYMAEKAKEKESIVYAGESGAEKKPEVPRDASALVIAGATAEMPAGAIAAIEKYLDRGGHLMVLFDVVLTADGKALRESGIEGLVRKHGIESVDEVALRVITNQFVDPYRITATAPPKSENSLAKQFWGRGIDFRTARVIRPGGAPGRAKADPVMVSVPQISPAAAVKDIAALRDPVKFSADLRDEPNFIDRIRNPLPIVVAVSVDNKPRMVVFGDTEFVSNYSLIAERGRGEEAYSLFVSSLEWMAEKEGLIGPRPKVTTNFSLPPTVAAEPTRIHLVPMWLMLLTVVGLGTGIWLVRRR